MLFYSPFHTFVHKVLVTAHECGHWDQLERIATFPFKNNEGEDCGDSYDITPLNPLDKVPTLVTDDGQAVFGSQAICEYLDATALTGKMYPEPGPKRWNALCRLSLSDSIFESTVQMVMEQWKPRDQWNMGLFEWLWPKFTAGLDYLERDVARGGDSFDVGHAAMLHAISYLGFRAEFYEAIQYIPILIGGTAALPCPHGMTILCSDPLSSRTTTGPLKAMTALQRVRLRSAPASHFARHTGYDRPLLLANTQRPQSVGRARGDGARL